MANIPIRDISNNITPSASDYLVLDNGQMGKAHLSELADSVRPVASQEEAQTGSDNTKTMTPLRVKDSLESEIGVTIASKSQGDAADSALQPGDIGTSVQGYDSDLAAIAALTPLDNDILQRKSGAWTNRTVAQVKSDLSLAAVATSGDYDDLSNKPTLGTAAAASTSDFATAAQGMKADSAVQPARKVDAGTGLSGGGDFSADRVIALDSTSQASLAKADSAVQPGDLGNLATKDKVSVGDIDATGVPSSSTYLRGDMTWAAGGGGGGGDLLAANNLSDLDDADTALTNLGGTTVGKDVFTASDGGDARSVLGLDIYRWQNWIINGDFRINQRGGTRTPGVGVYGYDRWKGHANGLEQVVEGLPAGDYTVGWDGGGTGTFAGVTAASPFMATSAGGNVSVVVPADATNVYLVRGDATKEAAPFAPRPIGQELALCQRYYEQFTSSDAAGGFIGGANWFGSSTGSGLSVQATAFFKVIKRVAPTVTGTIRNSSGTFTPSTPAMSSSIYGVNNTMTTNSAAVNCFVSTYWTADAEF